MSTSVQRQNPSQDSTPYKKTTGGHTGVYTHETLDPLLRDDLKSHTFSSVSVLDFLEHGFGFDDSSIKYWEPKLEEIMESKEFKEAVSHYNVTMQNAGELSMYKPFVEITDIILQKADEMDENEDGNPLGIKFVDYGSYPIKSKYAQRKPDVLTLPGSTDLRYPTWVKALVVWEFKKRASSEGKRKSEDGEISSSSKRQRTGTGGSKSSANVKASHTSGLSKVSPFSALKGKNNQVQLAGYITEMFSSSAYREWAFGGTVIGDTMTLRYYDRTCSVVTSSIKYVGENMREFVLLILALRSCDFAKFGFSSLFQYHDKQNPSTIENAYLKPPVPVEQIPDESVERMNWKPDDVIHSGDIIHSGYCVFGRATVVQKVKVGCKEKVDWTDKTSKGGLVIKMSWQVKTRKPEEEIIKKARTINKTNTPAMLLSFTHERTLPSKKLMEFCEQKGESWEFRCLRIIVFVEYRPLYELKGEKYKRAFFQIIICYWELNEKGGILHRDFSVFNLMYEVRNGLIYGILNDFDLSIILLEDKSIPEASSKHRTGTAPFMAHELLNIDVPVQHLYRHDLESLLYIAVWTFVGYEGREYSKGTNGPLEIWRSHDWKIIWGDKKAFLTTYSHFTKISAYITEDYQELKSVLKKFYSFFSNAVRKASMIEGDMITPSQGLETKEDEYRTESVAVAAGQKILLEALTWEKLLNLFDLHNPELSKPPRFTDEAVDGHDNSYSHENIPVIPLQSISVK